MKHHLTLFVLCTLVANASNGAVRQMPLNRLGADLKGSYPGDTRVWIEKRNQRVNVDSNGVILKGYDVVAYFTQHKPIKGSPNYKTNHQGATYYFSSAADLAVFERNPSKYVPQYGGFCANGVKNNRLDDSDPTVFRIVKEKLYVCSSPAAQQEFHVRSLESIIRAQRNWEQMFH